MGKLPCAVGKPLGGKSAPHRVRALAAEDRQGFVAAKWTPCRPAKAEISSREPSKEPVMEIAAKREPVVNVGLEKLAEVRQFLSQTAVF
jgi:hypothetical protein